MDFDDAFCLCCYLRRGDDDDGDDDACDEYVHCHSIRMVWPEATQVGAASCGEFDGL